MGSQSDIFLPLGRDDIPVFTPNQTMPVLNLATPEGCKAELTYSAGYIPRWCTGTRPQTVTHPSTNRVLRALTSFIYDERR